MSARDVLATSLWLIDREIAGAPLPHPSWATFRENDPETAMIYETQAGCHLSVLSAAGFVVVPAEPTIDMIVAGTEDWLCIRAQEDRAEAIYRAMLAAAKETGHE